MLKFIVLFALVAFVLAGVVPKPPAVHENKATESSPAVKGVPLHPELHSSTSELPKITEVKPEAKKIEHKKEEHHLEASTVKHDNVHAKAVHENHKEEHKPVLKHEEVKAKDSKAHH